MPFRPRRFARLALLPALLLFAVGFALLRPAAPPAPGSPQEAQSMFEIEEGFDVELYAAEPLLVDPVAMEIDEEGRVYVVELRAYPNRQERISTIKLLVDDDGDGRPDRSTIFADSLWMPKGALRWKNGLLVPDGADLLYLEDSDGDGRADVRRVLLTGFDFSNPQSGINSPLYGLDNWVYLAHNTQGTELRRPGGGPQPPSVARRNFRFNPETGEVQALAAATQFGHTFDAWGRHLLTSNANHLFQEVIGARYLARNPDLLVGSATVVLPAHGAAADVFPIAVNPGYQLFTDMGVVTSASGVTAYLGGAFPGYEGVTFVGEPSHNLVHVDRLEERGATFTARRMQEGREFLASRDGRFRPVNFYVGPDGAMYVLDYYRDIVEQPRYLSEEVMESGALFDGSDKGRIWRIVPEGGLPLKRPGEIRLGSASTTELVALLEDPNVWYRRTAQRLLVDRDDAAAAEPLERLARGSARPEGRLHALWTLQGIDRLQPRTILAALGDPHPGVRENAIQLAEPHLAASPELAAALVAMQPTAQGRVAYQLLLTLGDLDTPAARTARERLLMAGIEQEWMQVAALTARGVDASQLLDSTLPALAGQETPARTAYFRRLGGLMATRDAQVAATVRRLADPGATAADGWWRGALLSGMAERLDSATLARADLPVLRGLLLETFFATDADPVRSAALSLLERVELPVGPDRAAALARAAIIARDPARPAAARADAVGLLARYDAPRSADLFTGVLTPESPVPVQLAAVRALREVEGLERGRVLIDRWPTLTEQVRSEAINVLLLNPDLMRLLIEAIEERKVQPSVVGWARSKRLMQLQDPVLRARGEAIFSPEMAADDEVVARYSAAIDLPGDAARGEAVYAATCSMCHQLGGTAGIAFGPDLATVRSRRTEFLLADILLPSREIASGYEQWVVHLAGGEELVGVIPEQTATAVTLRMLGGAERTIARADIREMESVPMSAMPDGLGAQLDVQRMADLVAFLRRPAGADTFR